jgi:PIN domain nuclease of toxin-antitoxin system
MIRAVADTHAILWYLYDDARLSRTAIEVMDSAEKDGEQIAISAITLAEIVYLVEKGKIPAVAFERMVATLHQVNTMLLEIPFDHAIADVMRQIDRAQVPDFPDRIIAATAIYLGVPLISRDRKIRTSIVTTIW